MATHPHPVEHDAEETGEQEAEPNTSRLPVEPEFAPASQWHATEPEDPAAKKPHTP